jgi:hypothetical protein
MHDGKAITKLQTVYSKSVPKIEKSNFVWIRIYKIEMDRKGKTKRIRKCVDRGE